MYGGHRVVCVTAAGRRRYLRYLIPMVVSSPLVDRYDLWVNTNDNCDVEFLLQAGRTVDKIRLVKAPCEYRGLVDTISSFWQTCDEPETIYIRLDDDIVWMESDFFETILKFRVDNPQYLFVCPMVVNNAKCTFLLRSLKKIRLRYGTGEECCDPVLWGSAMFAKELHEWFLEKYAEKDDLSPLYFDFCQTGLSRVSINSLVWFGKDVHPYCGTKYHEEIYYSVVLPARIGKVNCICGGTYIVHYAFCSQRWMLDRTNLSERYSDLLRKRWRNEPAAASVCAKMDEIISCIDSDRKKINSRPSFYPAPPFQKSLSYRINAFCNRYVVPAAIVPAIVWNKLTYRRYIEDDNHKSSIC